MSGMWLWSRNNNWQLQISLPTPTVCHSVTSAASHCSCNLWFTLMKQVCSRQSALQPRVLWESHRQQSSRCLKAGVQAEIMASLRCPLPLPVCPVHPSTRVQQSAPLCTLYLWHIPTIFTPVAMETTTDAPKRCKQPALGILYVFFFWTGPLSLPLLKPQLVGCQLLKIPNTKFVTWILHQSLKLPGSRSVKHENRSHPEQPSRCVALYFIYLFINQHLSSAKQFFVSLLLLIGVSVSQCMLCNQTVKWCISFKCYWFFCWLIIHIW